MTSEELTEEQSNVKGACVQSYKWGIHACIRSLGATSMPCTCQELFFWTPFFHSSDQVGHLRDNGAFKRHLSQLQVLGSIVVCLVFWRTVLSQTGLRYVFDAINLRNNDAMEELLQLAIQKAVGKQQHWVTIQLPKEWLLSILHTTVILYYVSLHAGTDSFQEDCTNHNRLPRTTSTFNAIVESASAEATKVYPCASVLCMQENLSWLEIFFSCTCRSLKRIVCWLIERSCINHL